MKKILMSTIGMLVLCGNVVLANEAVMRITAEVVKPITVISNGDMHFGRIAQGESKSEDSSFTIKGHEHTDVNVTFPGTTELNGMYSTSMVNGNGEKLEVLFNVYDMANKESNLSELKLDGNGRADVRIEATANATDIQAEGTYAGTITMRAIYN